MPDFERSTIVAATPDDAFRFLADTNNLPRYIASMVLAEPTQGEQLRVAAEVQGRHEEGDARFRVDSSRLYMEWSGQGEGGYHGWLQVSESGQGASVSIHVHAERDQDESEIIRAMEETASNIERLLGPG